jgi:hypothetical protein
LLLRPVCVLPATNVPLPTRVLMTTPLTLLL